MTITNWITSEEKSDKAVYFRKVFSSKNCKKAILKISALGWVKVFINGEAVTEEEFLPGWTDYTKRVLLFSYDVTHLIREQNVLGAVVGKGWAMGTTLFGELDKYYQISTPCLYARIEWIDEQGNCYEEETECWKFSYGTIIENDIMMGETQDYYQENKGIFQVGFDDSLWKNASIFKHNVVVEDSVLPRVSVHEVFIGKKLKNGIYDFGQNFSGVVRLIVRAYKHTEIIVRHGEILDEQGELYVENLRTAKAIDKYILPKGEYVLRPWFTYHGFRYAQISVNGNAEILSCEGLAIYTDSPIAGEFKASSPLVNQIASNCLWSLKSNLHYLPTDCPQRDERLGWLGDAGIIARSTMYQFDCKEMWQHYLSVIVEAIREDGAIPCIAPNAKGFLDNAIGASGWADSFITLLADYYDFYADKAILEKYFPYAENFIKWLDNNSSEYRRNTYCFSDWLSVNADLKEGYGDVDFQVFDLCFYAIDCLHMQRFCEILNKDSTLYQEKYEKAKKFFLNHLYINGTIVGGGKETALLLTYKAGILTGEEIKAELVSDVETNGLTCGFIGAKYFLPVLTELGRSDLAYKLITSTEYPSWGYSVVNGATTMWERWDSYVKGKGVNAHGMNSFNHFAFGTCAEWFYSDVLGIKISSDNTQVIIAPSIDESRRITTVSGSYHSRFGKIYVDWQTTKELDDLIAYVNVSIPDDISVQFVFSGWEIVESKSTERKKTFILKKEDKQ